MMVQGNPFGILLGFIFIAAIGAFFYWALRVPPSSRLPVARAHRSAEETIKILVPLVEAMPSQRAVELACHWGNSKKRELVLVHVIVMPDTLSLDAPMPERDQAANDALDLANLIAQRHNCPAQMYIVRHRSAAEGVLQVAREEQVDAIILASGEPRIPGGWDRLTIEILRRASCEVIVDKAPNATQPMSLNVPVKSAEGT